MEKLSEYIPIIIILVTVIFSMIGKKKKPNTVTHETTLPGSEAGEFIDIEELQRTLSGLDQEFTGEKTIKPSLNKPENRKEKEVIPSLSSEITILETDEEKGNPPFSFEGEDDVMKAIIYAEIINKREY